MSSPVAIVLRGPTGVGKSAVGAELQQRLDLPQRNVIVLDNGWGGGECRWSGGPNRYADLRVDNSGLLILELAYGDSLPRDPDRGGATSNPHEWISVLQEQNRSVHIFLLWASWEHIEQRVLRRGRPSLADARSWYEAYQRPPLSDFAMRAGIHHDRLATSGRTPEEVATLILESLRKVCLVILGAFVAFS